MANKPKPQERDRRAMVDEMRREQQARERRKSLLFIGGAILVGVSLIAVVAIPAYQESKKDPTVQALGDIGVSTSEASCSAATTDKVGDKEHVANGTKVKYATVPPSSGNHWNPPVRDPLEFYTAENRPPVEELVHNLEHGYTIVWYDSTIKGDQLNDLKTLASKGRALDETVNGKFIVSAWDNAYGKFPAGKHVAISHWSLKAGHRQLCGKLSGDAVAAFVKKYPASDAPEAGAA